MLNETEVFICGVKRTARTILSMITVVDNGNLFYAGYKITLLKIDENGMGIKEIGLKNMDNATHIKIHSYPKDGDTTILKIQ